jgi:predicted acetyltransferase
VYVTDWTIDTGRARWVGPRPAGRLDAIDRQALRDDLAQLHERVRERSPGQVAGWPTLWRRVAGLAPGQPDGAKVRGVRYTDEAGVTRGVVAYTVDGGEDDFSRHTLHVHQLIADGDAAYAALWRYLLEHDLVATVRAGLLSAQEPLRWLVADQRGLAITQDGHHWLRVLDVPAALTARRYSAPAEVVLRVVDPLGLADGTWRVEMAPDGSCSVEPAGGEADVTLPVAALGSILLGGVPVTTLARAGIVTASDAVAGRLDLAFAAAAPPLLSLWY